MTRQLSVPPRAVALRAVAAATAVLAASVVLTACGDHKDKVAAIPSPTPTPTVASPKPVSDASPLTGLPHGMGKPVLVVKIDNTRPAHPQVGIDQADIVYLEQVEAGLTRLAAVFSGTLPSTVGPVRSARETDIELFAQYGRVAFAYSGAQAAVRRALAKANLYLAVDGFGGGWFRGRGHAPYNLFARPASLLKARSKAALVKDVGFRFGPISSLMQRVSGGVDVRYKAASVKWRWNASKHKWMLWMDGSVDTTVGHGQIGVDNVIVQIVPIKKSRLHDINGNHTPYTFTVGSGGAYYFRDGRVIAGHWSRKSATAGTYWSVGKGSSLERYPMKPGRTWIILVGSTSRVHLA